MKHPARVFMVSLLVGLAASGCGREGRESRQKKAPTDYQLALEKINGRLYDARKHGLKTLSFDMTFEPALDWTSKHYTQSAKIASVTVYWRSPDRMNILPRGSDGKLISVHPVIGWRVSWEYLRKSLPVGLRELTPSFVPDADKGKVESTSEGYSVTVERPERQDGKSVTRIKTVYQLNKNFAPMLAEAYRVTGAGAPPPDEAYDTTRYRILDNGYSVLAEEKYPPGSNLVVAHTKVGRFWLPKSLKITKGDGESGATTRVVFTRYKINSRLPRSALVPPEWPRAKLDLSSPERTLRSLYDALYLGDLDGIGRCLSKESRSKWKDDLAELRRQYDVTGKLPPGFEHSHWRTWWRTWWSGFIHANAGKTSKLLLSEEELTDATFTARLRTVTTGRKVDLQVRLVKEGRTWKVGNMPEEIMKGYD